MDTETYKYEVCHQIIDNLLSVYSTFYDKQLSSMHDVVDGWTSISSQKSQSFYDNIRNVVEISLQLSNAQKQIMVRHKQDGHLFNAFSLWNRLMGISEPIHSRILHFLLSDDDLHGQGNLFQQELLKQLNIEKPEVGQWFSGAELDRVDVRLVRQEPHSVVIIENKSNWAGDQPNQLYRYWYSNIHRCTEDCLPSYYENNGRYRIIYLVPKDIKQLSEQSLLKPLRNWFYDLSDDEYESLPDKLPIAPIVWSFDVQIDQWLQRCEELLNVKNTPLRNFIKQYRLYCKQL